MNISWTPVILVDIIGSALTLSIAVVCAYYAWQWAKQKSDDVFRQYIFLLTLAIVCFAISRSFGHLVKQVLLLSDLPHTWKQISPFSGAINSAMFIVIFAFGIYFHRVQKVHAEIEQYRKNLESLVVERTGQLKKSNKALQNEINERKQIEKALMESDHNLRAEIKERKLREEELRHAQKALKKQFQFEELMSKISTEFINLSIDQIDQKIDQKIYQQIDNKQKIHKKTIKNNDF